MKSLPGQPRPPPGELERQPPRGLHVLQQFPAHPVGHNTLKTESKHCVQQGGKITISTGRDEIYWYTPHQHPRTTTHTQGRHSTRDTQREAKHGSTHAQNGLRSTLSRLPPRKIQTCPGSPLVAAAVGDLQGEISGRVVVVGQQHAGHVEPGGLQGGYAANNK